MAIFWAMVLSEDIKRIECIRGRARRWNAGTRGDKKMESKSFFLAWTTHWWWSHLMEWDWREIDIQKLVKCFAGHHSKSKWQIRCSWKPILENFKDVNNSLLGLRQNRWKIPVMSKVWKEIKLWNMYLFT